MDQDPDPDSLFIPNDGGGDDDQVWEPPNFERDEEDEMLGWDASNNDLGASMRSQRPTIRDLKAPPVRANRDIPPEVRQDREVGESLDAANMPPTQRLSQVSIFACGVCLLLYSPRKADPLMQLQGMFD